MRATQLLHDLLDNACQSIDKRIRKTLFAAAETLTRCKQLSIATLAVLILWLFGTAAKQQGLHFSFQANTVKTRNVLSIFIIGWQLLIRCTAAFHKKELRDALDHITSSTAEWTELC